MKTEGVITRDSAAGNRPEWKIVLIASGSFLLVWAWFSRFNFHVIQADVLDYWVDSLAWRTPFNPDHVPGYPLLIALFRYVAAGYLNPVILVMVPAFCAHIAGALGVYACVAPQSGSRVGYFSVFLFTLWPFVGTTYAVFPMSDSIALALLAWGVALLFRERFRTAAIPLGLAAVIHKGTWIFIIALMLAAIIQNRRRFSWSALVIASLPLGILWVAGMVMNGYAPDWLVSVSLPIQFATKSNLPVLDGMVGTLLLGGWRDILKSVVLWGHFALLICLLVSFIRQRSSAPKWYGLALLGGLLFLYCGLNHKIIWAAVRFSKIAALPLGLYLGGNSHFAALIEKRSWSLGALVLLLLASQFAYALYMARIFH